MILYCYVIMLLKFTKMILVSICSYIIFSFTIVRYICVCVCVCVCYLLYFMWPSTLFYLYECLYHSCDYLTYFTSVITCIPSWDISEYSPYLISSYECLSISLHVWRIIIFDSRLVVVHLRPWLGLILRLAWFIFVDLFEEFIGYLFDDASNENSFGQ